MDPDIIRRLRDRYTAKQLMVYEDRARRIAEHLTQARALLLNMPEGADVAELDAYISETADVLTVFHAARHG